MLFHHIITFSLLIISLFYNIIPCGIITIVIHDISDIFRSISRIFSKYSVRYTTIGCILNISYFICWIITRVIIFPSCLIN